MSEVWTRLDAVITAHGGTVEKHMGDAVMAFFGDKRAREDAPTQAVRAGLAMQASLNDLQTGGAGVPLQLRIGIHTGLVVLERCPQRRVQGQRRRHQPDQPFGAECAGGRSAHIPRYLPQRFWPFDVQVLPPLRVKGKPEPIEAYLVERAKPKGLTRQMPGCEGPANRDDRAQAGAGALAIHLQSVLEERQLQVVRSSASGIGKSRCCGNSRAGWSCLPQRVRLFAGQATPTCQLRRSR